MQFVKQGPEIPEQLLQAHEEGRVVFFCGAGISYPAGLPGFCELVDQLYTELGTVPSCIEQQAYSRDQYDATLDLLERRIPGQRLAVRLALAKVLKPNLRRKGATDNHTALLQLARGRDGAVRLVTTNFDRIFQGLMKRAKPAIPAYPASASCPSLSTLLDLPLPAVHRTLGPMRLDEALKTLAGPAHIVVIDPVHRLVSFELRQRYASLASMATPRAAVDAGKTRAPAGLAAEPHALPPLLRQTAGRRRIGPIRQHAQLWPIAADLREAFRATTEQLMVGLYEANPGSFCHRNLHCLKVAAYLEVPQATRVVAVRPLDAHRTVQRHLEAWRHRSRGAHVADTPPRAVVP